MVDALLFLMKNNSTMTNTHIKHRTFINQNKMGDVQSPAHDRQKYILWPQIKKLSKFLMHGHN